MDPGRAYKSRRHEEQQSYSEVWDDCFESDPTKDLFGCLDKNEKIFQARMREILEKYNKPFEDDVLVDIKSLAYITPNESLFQDSNLKASSAQRTHARRKEPKSEAAISAFSETFLCGEGDLYHADNTNDSQLEKESDDAVCNETFIISDENSSECHLENPNDSQLVEFKGSSPLKHLSEMRHGKTYAANVDIILQANETSIPKAFTVQCTEENSFSFKVSPMKFGRNTYDHGNTADISRQYLINTRAAHTNASPVKVSISSHLKSFFGRHQRDVSTVVDQHNLKQKDPDEYNFGDDEDSDSSDPLDVSLADYYPSMIVCLSRLMEIPCKQQAAANIIKHYRRRVWCANKNRPDIKKPKKRIGKSDNSKLVSSLKPKSKKTSITFLKETNKPVPHQHTDFEESGIIEYKERRVYDRPFHAMSSHKATFPVSEKITNPILLPKEKYHPDKPLKPEFKTASSPKYDLPKCVPQDNKLIRKSTSNQFSVALLNQRQLKYDAFVPKIQVSPKTFLTKVPQRSVPLLTRRHSFSTFSDKNRCIYDGAFETLYRRLLSEGSHQRSLPQNTQYPLSDTVNALINSPILNKGKRPASEDLPFSKFKRYRSATETFVLDTSNPKMYALPSQTTIGSDLWQGSSQRWNPKEHPGQPILSLSRSPGSSGSLSTWLYSRSPKYLETFSLPSSPVQRASSRKLNYN